MRPGYLIRVSRQLVHAVSTEPLTASFARRTREGAKQKVPLTVGTWHCGRIATPEGAQIMRQRTETVALG
eukprot:COSAG02_NODE_55732_length_289_cov_0.552632_1_plen_69_part_10